MKVKQGVKMTALGTQALLGVMVATRIYDEYDTELVITSVTDGRHSKNSRHYRGDAVDLRTRNLPNPAEDGPAVVEEMRGALGPDFDILFEGDHIHLEYDPKREE